ncbi:MAG: tetratricopeptide repeat protein [Bacteroidota bacterium]
MKYMLLFVLLGLSGMLAAQEASAHALELAQSGEYEEALKFYRVALDEKPKSSQNHYYKGLCEFELGKLDSAYVSFTKAISIVRNRPDLYFYRGRTLFLLDRYEEALPDLDKAIKLDPRMGDYYLFRGRTRISLQQIEEAHKDFSRAIETDRRVGTYYLDRGTTRLILQDTVAGCSDIKLAYEKRAFNASYWWKICQSTDQ